MAASDRRLHPSQIDEASLMEWSGYRQRARLEGWLRQQKIPYLYGSGGRIITTQSAIDSVLIGVRSTIERDTIEFE